MSEFLSGPYNPLGLVAGGFLGGVLGFLGYFFLWSPLKEFFDEPKVERAILVVFAASLYLPGLIYLVNKVLLKGPFLLLGAIIAVAWLVKHMNKR